MNRLYLAGPMRGYEQWNFPAFDRYAAELRSWGFEVTSPAELDREAGFNEHIQTLPDGFVQEALRRDVAAILTVDAIALMPGWRDSEGVSFELDVAAKLGVPAYEIVDGGLAFIEEESVLSEADRIVAGERQQSYGHPMEDFTRTGRMWGAILGIDDVPPETVGLCMVAVKLSRECNQPKRDNRVDGAGYFKTVDLVHRRRAEP